MRFPIEIVRRMREAVGRDFIIVYRLSMLDLVDESQSWTDIVTLGKAIEAAGATIINTGIGWHEARIPTIVTSVPRGAFTWVTRRMKGEVGIPLVTTNRINMPDVAERILAQGDADMVSMARPLLADPEWVNKARALRPESINTCIACNQACLDHVFENRRASCMVNPRACHETELNDPPRDGEEARRGSGRRPGRPRRRGHDPRRARTCGHVVRPRARKSAASSTWPGAYPAKRNSARRCAISTIVSMPPACERRLGVRCDRRRRLRMAASTP